MPSQGCGSLYANVVSHFNGILTYAACFMCLVLFFPGSLTETGNKSVFASQLYWLVVLAPDLMTLYFRVASYIKFGFTQFACYFKLLTAVLALMGYMLVGITNLFHFAFN